MRWLRALLLISAGLVPALVYGAPSISSAPCTWSHGSSCTINGTGFGTKSTAAPVIWDDASGSSMSAAGWSLTWPNSGSSAYYLDYRSAQRGIALPHNRITKYIAGSHGDSGTAGGGAAVMMWKNRTISYPAYYYTSYYSRVDDAWVFGGDDNFKTMDWSIGSGGYDLPNNWYLEACNSCFTSRSASPDWHMNDDTGFPTGNSLIFNDQNGHNAYWNTMENPANGSWSKIEMEIAFTNQTSGYVKVWENGTLRLDYAGKTDGMAGTDRSFGIGGYARNYGQPNNWRYFSDVYLDYSRARALICTGSTLSARGICEPQIPTAWASTSVTVKANLGANPDGANRYLYLCDDTGSCNSSGFSITTASGGAPPVATGSCTPNPVQLPATSACSGSGTNSPTSHAWNCGAGCNTCAIATCTCACPSGGTRSATYTATNADGSDDDIVSVNWKISKPARLRSR